MHKDHLLEPWVVYDHIKRPHYDSKCRSCRVDHIIVVKAKDLRVITLEFLKEIGCFTTLLLVLLPMVVSNNQLVRLITVLVTHFNLYVQFGLWSAAINRRKKKWEAKEEEKSVVFVFY